MDLNEGKRKHIAMRCAPILEKKMTAADAYLAALREAAGLPAIQGQSQERGQRKAKPKRLAGGCLLYQLPVRRGLPKGSKGSSKERG